MIQKINILDSSQSGVKNGADSEAVLAALTEHLELINPSGRLSQNTRSAMLQLREEEWSEFFFWLLNSLECLDYVIINLTPESKKTLMSERRNNIQVAIDALYSQRRRKSPGDESETLTRRNDAIFGNHVWQTFAQYFPPGLEKPSV
ncbi:TPA: protein YcgY [Escherichia coli]